ncbi:MAG: right-handed parallel beta-helix repeat-containing protein [candidate division WOR-3 bacterium]
MKRLIFLSIIFGISFARIIVVPDSAPTIQGGLNLALSGDTVLVKPGQYRENITWPNRDGIKLYSLSGPDSTIINGGGNGRVINIPSGITRATEIRGFKIIGGKANSGAGIYAGGSPTIIRNKICNNTCAGGRDYGGGIFCYYGTSPLIIGNEITDNTCSDTATWNYGGGIYVDMNSTAEICYNLIARNTCSQGYWNYGAGIYVDLRASPLIYQNVIKENINTLGDRGHGAGIYVSYQANALIFSNLIIDNRNTSGSWNYGGGIKVDGRARIINNTIAGNICSGGYWAYGAGIYIESDTSIIKNNIIVQNSSTLGSGIYNNGIVINRYNDIWNNIGGNYYGCSPGPGEISLDPIFVSGPYGPYYLSQTAAGQPVNSPCVDAGDTLLGTTPLNFDSLLRSWTTRTDSVPDLSVLDMGYHYPRTQPYVGISSISSKTPIPFQVFPNPFRHFVKFSPLMKPAPAQIEITDISGKIVYQSASFNYLWKGVNNLGRPLPAGIYFYQIRYKNRNHSGRLIKID